MLFNFSNNYKTMYKIKPDCGYEKPTGKVNWGFIVSKACEQILYHAKRQCFQLNIPMKPQVYCMTGLIHLELYTIALFKHSK